VEEKYAAGKANGNNDGESDSSDDETEDEDAFLLTEELDAQMSAALSAIKNKDPRIYDPDAKFYDDPEGTVQERPKEAKEKPVYLRDYHRERYMRGDVGADDEDEASRPKTYIEEQEEVKKSVLAEINAAAEDASEGSSDEDGDFIKKKPRPEVGEVGEDGVHPSRAAKIQPKELDVANADKDPELYLSNFMASKAWVPEGGSRWQAFESDDEDNDGDWAEEFENAYNMRFEDPTKSNEVLKSYSRTMTASRSVRREDKTGRKVQREREKEKKEAEKRERKEERARLRNLKIEEAQEKLKKIKQAAGMSGKSLEGDEWMTLLEDAWENDKWEEEMSKKFGDQYYAEDDEASARSDEGEAPSKKSARPKKPKWDDDIDINDLIPDFEDEDARPDVTLTDSEDDADEGGRPTKKRKTAKEHKKDRADAKRAARIERSKIETLVDTQMELDEPSALASSSSKGPQMAFRYRETSPNSFGLTASDILMAPSDAALNEFVGLKKLATFRDPEKKRKDKKRLGKKARLRQWRRDNFGAEFEHSGPDFAFGGPRRPAPDTTGGPPEAGAEGEQKKKKRKRSKGKRGAGDAAVSS